MFDPTVWDNLKVVLEGAIYDLDMDGVITIMDRNDTVNLAKMSRLYEIKFKLKGETESYPISSVTLFTDIDNISRELQGIKDKRPGCKLELKFYTKLQSFTEECPKIEQIIQDIWGKLRNLKQEISFPFMVQPTSFLDEITIGFDRNIYEENIDDLTEMIPFIIKTLKSLRSE